MKNPQYEQALTKQGVTFDYLPKVELDEINLQKGLTNQARLEKAIVEDLVVQYVAAIKEGDEFPPVVLGRLGKGKYFPLDGNQRLASYDKVGKKWTDAYLVQSQDPMVLDRISWSFNNKVNGLRLTYGECLAHAVSFVRKYGITQEAAAKEWGVPKWAIGNEVRATECREVLERHKVKNIKNLSNDQLRALAALQTLGEEVFVPAAQAVAESGASTKDIYSLMSSVRKAKTHAAKVAEVQAFVSSDLVETRRAETKGGTIKARTPLPRERLARTLREVANILDQYDKKALLSPNKEIQKEIRNLAAGVVHSLIVVYGLGTTLQEEAS